MGFDLLNVCDTTIPTNQTSHTFLPSADQYRNRLPQVRDYRMRSVGAIGPVQVSPLVIGHLHARMIQHLPVHKLIHSIRIMIICTCFFVAAIKNTSNGLMKIVTLSA